MKKRFYFLTAILLLGYISNIHAYTIDVSKSYFLVQTTSTSSKVVGASSATQPAVMDADKTASQQLSFELVSAGIYRVKNGNGNYLNWSTGSTLVYSASIGSSAEWTVADVSSTGFVSLKSVSGGNTYLTSSAVTSGSALISSGTTAPTAAGNNVFKLVLTTSMLQNNMIDGGFENCITDNAPIGTWINDLGRSMGGAVSSRVQTSNNQQSSGLNSFLLRFLATATDAKAYNKISHLITNLTPGAPYLFSFNYTQANDITAGATMNVYASTTANAASGSVTGTICTTTIPSTTTTKQSGTFTFTAPATSCYVVFSRNSTSKNYTVFLDDIVLTVNPYIAIDNSSFEFIPSNSTGILNITSQGLTADLILTPPTGISLSGTNLENNGDGTYKIVNANANTSNSVMVVWDGTTAIASGNNISITSTNATTKNVAVIGNLSPSILVSKPTMSFNTTSYIGTFSVTGGSLTEAITLTAPTGLILSGPNVTGSAPTYFIDIASANEVNTITATWDKAHNIASGTLTISSTGATPDKTISINTTDDVESVAITGITLGTGGVLSPTFASGTSSYTVKAPADISSVTATATVSPTIANVTNNGTSVSLGTASVTLTGNSYNGVNHTSDYVVNWGGNYTISDWSANGDASSTNASLPSTYGWKCTNIGSPNTVVNTWNNFGNQANCRYKDSPGYTYNGNAYNSRILLIRWDGTGGNNSTSVYSYPVYLEVCKAYNFTGKAAYNSVASAGILTFNINATKDNTGQSYGTGSVSLGSTSGVLKDISINNFRVPSSGIYYITITSSNGALDAVTDLSITQSATELFSVSKSYLFFDNALNGATKTFIVQGNVLQNDISLTAPTGITLSTPSVSAANNITIAKEDAQCEITVTATYDKTVSINNGNISITCGSFSNSIGIDATKTTNLLTTWDANGITGTNSEANKWGWASTYASATWGAANGSVIRFVDGTTSSSLLHYNANRTDVYKGRLFLYRWDANFWGSTLSLGNSDGTGSNTTVTPISLSADKAYRLKGAYEWWSNGTQPTYSFGFSTTQSAGTVIATQLFTYPYSNVTTNGNQLQPLEMNFVCPTTGSYYIQVKQTSGSSSTDGTIIGLANLSLVEVPTVKINYLNQSDEVIKTARFQISDLTPGSIYTALPADKASFSDNTNTYTYDAGSTDNVTVIDGSAVINLKFTSVANSTLTYTFTGASNSNLSNAANWQEGTVPPNGSIINVASGLLDVDQNTTADNITLAPGTKLTLNSSKTLNVNGTMTLQSDATGTATFVDNNSSGGLTVSGTTNVNQYLTYRTWYLSSPVASSTPTGMDRIKKYDETLASDNWVLTSTMSIGNGYLVVPVSGNSIQFSGTMNNGSISIPLTRTDLVNTTKPGFNLIGNPYPSYLDWTSVYTANSSIMPTSTMWYRTKDAGEYTFWTVNGASGAGVPVEASQYIPPMQAFWVRANANNVSLVLNNAMRSHAPVSNNQLRVPATRNTANQQLRLQVTNGTNTDEALIYFNTNASNSFDTYDSPKMSNDNPAIPEIYTAVGNEQLVINGMNSIPVNQEIGLGFVPGTGTAFSIKANEISNFPADIRVILKDNITTRETDLTDGTATYQFEPIVTSANRFSVIFRTSGTITNLENTGNDAILVYCNEQNKITVSCNSAIKTTPAVFVFNSVGQCIATQRMMSNILIIDQTFAPGVYFVKVNNTTRKVIVK